MMTETFASMAHRVLITNKSASIKTVAGAMGISAESLYARLYGRTPFHAEELRAFFGVVQDLDLANYFVGSSQMVVVRRCEFAGTAAESLQRGAVATLLDATDVVRATEAALADGRVDHREKSEILKQVVETERAIASLKSLLESL